MNHTSLMRRFLPYLILIISSVLLCWDLFSSPGQPANMDGTVHISNIASFYRALTQKNIPVGWTDGYANYGLPMGYFAQQTTSYIGAIVTFLTQDVVTSFNFVYLLGTVLSACLFYYFLQLFFSAPASLSGALLFQFAPYRILNIYIRGALPEYFTSVFVILILICLVKLSEKIQYRWIVLNALGVAGVILTHPMNVITSLFILIPFTVWLFFRSKMNYLFFGSVIVSSLYGLLLTGYYLLPLLIEIKYFYYSQTVNHLTLNSYLGVANFFDPAWPYFIVNQNNIISRGHFVKTGLLESIFVLVSLIWLLWAVIKKKQFKNRNILLLFLGVAIVSLLMTTSLVHWLYSHISLLGGIQFPWRMLSTFILIPPILAAGMVDRLKHRDIAIIVLITVIFSARFPQLYGKNVTQYTDESYFKTIDNPHNIAMNTIWSGPSLSYAPKQLHGEIIEGEGAIVYRNEKNSTREYDIDAISNIRMSDNTFYFPGWIVSLDNSSIPIEYQDPNYRGVITYLVPAGKHHVEIKFVDTKVRKIGKYVSAFGAITLFLSFVAFKRFSKIFS